MNNKHQNLYLQSQKGLSFVELSVVLLAIGFLAVIVIAGQKLLEHSHIHKVITMINDHEQAIHNFRLKYKALPGDFRNAFAIWGTDCNTNATTCNGDGDGHLSLSGSPDLEGNKMWKHLELSGLIEGSYSGGNPTGTYRVGEDVPEIGFRNGGVYAFYDSHFGYLTTTTDLFVYGSEVDGNVNFGAVFTPEEVRRIDDKIDDGLPSTGTIMGSTSTANAGLGTCSNGIGFESFFGATEYTLTNNEIVCRMLVAKITNSF